MRLFRAADCTGYVNPFIGTLHEGHCVPGATVPMGMVQPGPESVDSLYEGYFMDHVTGYRYADRYLAGFTQTHLNGVGCPSMSDILLMPWCGREIAGTERGAFRSEYDKPPRWPHRVIMPCGSRITARRLN